jgi:lysyl-tRNA synthetase class 2
MLVLSACFGAGAAFILDEFALVLHLEDVYWTEYGRSSIDATLMGFAFGVLCMLATAPIHSDPSRDAPHWVVGGLIAVNTSFALIAFLKGKTKLGAFGIFVPGVAVVAGLRLAKPTSLWAHHRYSESKLDRSESRAVLQHRRYAGLKQRIYDAIGGAPHLEHGGPRVR